MVLIPFKLEYLTTIAFILVIAALVQFVEIFMKKMIPPLYRSLGIFLPLITTNCAILGTAILAVQKNYGFFEALIYAISTGVGFSIAIALFASIRERLRNSKNSRSVARAGYFTSSPQEFYPWRSWGLPAL